MHNKREAKTTSEQGLLVMLHMLCFIIKYFLLKI